MATALLHDMMYNEVEMYVDDMIVKSKDKESHTINLRKFFKRIKEYRLRLNPQKCTFKVTVGKLLGFLVSDRGIEVNPSKIKAILEMPPPKRNTVGSMLTQEDNDKNERTIYCLNKRFHDYETRKTIKGSVVSNFCVENPIKGEDGKEDFPDENILDVELGAWKIYFDGAVNQCRNGIGVLLITPEGSHIPLAIELNFEATNNMAEYEACIAGMEALELGVKEAKVFGDSTLVIA
ncbi:uncharacterized protein LOC115980864 [Quercus lobata]|uniref:uncharacterized protein LOC115980864 n=1 Tax=Quercus lobata TaxID=97700 RepID=UPI0012448AA4|nr:uncharacterized protein LOC115980864 [Quercus lobata]